MGKQLLFEQIKKLRPDILWLDDFELIDKEWISNLRENVASIRIITAQFCAPYESSDIVNFKALDFLITCTPCLQKEFQNLGIHTHLVYHSFDERILDNLDDNSCEKQELVFTGSLYTGGGFHKTRIEYLDEMINVGLPLKIWGNIDSPRRIFSKMLAYEVINILKKIGGRKLVMNLPLIKEYESFGDTPVKFYSAKLKANILPPVFGLEQFKLLSKARICFNIHGGIAKSCAGNLRLFEATGVGTCLVTDWKENLSDLFVPDQEVVTYKSKEECLEKIKWLLLNPSGADKIAAAGQKRTMKDHTTKNRVDELNRLFQSKIDNK